VNMRVDIIGYAAACFTTFSLLPQIIRIQRLKEAKDVSLVMPLMVAVGSVLWLVYGFLLASIPIVAANAIALVVALITIRYALKYR
jgi:MtN3 and saliva related transmembrane protein